MPKKNPAVERLRLQIWDLWVKSMPIEVIAARLNLTPAQVVQHLQSRLTALMKGIGKFPLTEARLEKIVAQFETLELYLFQQIAAYQTQWADAVQSGDHKQALRLSETIKELSDVLQTIVARKAELMRRFGLLPSAPERAMHLVGVVKTPDFNPLDTSNLNVIPRVPTKAPTALPNTSDNLADETLNVDIVDNDTVEID